MLLCRCYIKLCHFLWYKLSQIKQLGITFLEKCAHNCKITLDRLPSTSRTMAKLSNFEFETFPYLVESRLLFWHFMKGVFQHLLACSTPKCLQIRRAALQPFIVCFMFQGDSGGPLMCYFPDATKYYLIGITSFGFGCGRPKLPGIYVGAAHYRSWINSQAILFDKAFTVKVPHVLILLIVQWLIFRYVLWKSKMSIVLEWPQIAFRNQFVV